MRYIVLAVPALLACATRPPERRPIVNADSRLVEWPALVLDSAQCYALTYTNARNGASERLFPVWIALLPGKYGAAAEAKRNPSLSESEWDPIYQFRGWRQINADSIEVRFTGSFEGVSIRVVRQGENIAGRAVWLTDLLGRQEASMRVTGTRQTCPAEILSAKSG